MKSSPLVPSSLRRLVDELEPRWVDSARSRSAPVLRTVLLRELMQRLHAERSLRLAERPGERGPHPAVGEISRLETRIGELCGRKVDSRSLTEAIESAKRAPGTAANLPQEVIDALGSQRIKRADRKWEAAIAAQAAGHGWSFWALDAWVRLRTAEAFHEFLSRSIWPQGVVLFVEAAPSAAERKPLEFRDHWQGRWYATFDPEAPREPPGPQGYPGLLTDPEPPRWTLLAKAVKENE